MADTPTDPADGPVAKVTEDDIDDEAAIGAPLDDGDYLVRLSQEADS
ncbi:MAG TPA: hypothetical protein VK611_19580 [Acidimicrobiales bacterium]|nr:hypothetical protein [Acidimicrobiales bacterium]